MTEVQNSSGIDFNEFRVTNFSHTKGTVCLIYVQVNGWFFEHGRTNECHKTRHGWYILRIGGGSFLHCRS